MDALDLTLGWLALLAAALWLASLYVLARTFPLDPCAAPRLTMRHQAALLAVAAWCLLPAPVSLGDTVLRPEAAVLVTVGTLAAAWFGYRALCDALQRRPLLLAFVLYGLLGYAVWGYHQLFGASGAYLHSGALLLTLMASNLHGASRATQPCAARATLRRRHNRYLTLPLLFTLLCAHAPDLMANPYAWQLLLLIGGLLVLIWYGLEQALTPKWALSSALGVLALYVAMPDGLQREARARPAAPSFAAAFKHAIPTPEPLDTHREFALVQRIIQDRCLECHSRTPSNPVFQATPLVPTFDTPEQILTWKRAIHEQAVASQNMPLANLTQMSQAERDLLGLWIEKGGRIE